MEFLTDNPLRAVRDMKVDTDIQVVGGGKLLTSLIKMGLMDNLTVYTVPVMLGRGVPFIGETFGSEWELLMNMVMDDGIVVTEYKFKKSL